MEDDIDLEKMIGGKPSQDGFLGGLERYHQSVMERAGKPPRKIIIAWDELRPWLVKLDNACPCTAAQYEVIEELLAIKFEPYAIKVMEWAKNTQKNRRPRKSAAKSMLEDHYRPEWLTRNEKGDFLVTIAEIQDEIVANGGKAHDEKTIYAWRKKLLNENEFALKTTIELLRRRFGN